MIAPTDASTETTRLGPLIRVTAPAMIVAGAKTSSATTSRLPPGTGAVAPVQTGYVAASAIFAPTSPRTTNPMAAPTATQ